MESAVQVSPTKLKGEVIDMIKDKHRFETNISSNYLPNWDELYVVKEFLQNAVYAKSILKDDISITHDGEYAVIANNPSGFTKDKLLIGESDQRNVVGSPGNFGEGFKIALVAANRLNMDVHIRTIGFDVTSALEPSSLNKDVKSLVFYIEDTEHNEGTTFKVKCTEEVLEEAKTYFAVLQGLDPERTKTDSLMSDFEGIYSNGVKITDTPAVFGYNFTSSELINRDRTTVDMSMLKASTREILMDVSDEEVITELVKGITSDDSLLESQSGISFSMAKNIWKKVIEKLFGKRVALATGTESDTQARYRKFKVITGLPKNWQYFFSNDLEILPSNQLRATTVDTNKHKKASAEENKNMGWAKRLIKMYYADYGTVKVSEKVLDQYGNDCLGLYDRANDVIWISRDILFDKERLFKILLHETIHRETGASDNTEEFTRGWEQASWSILMKGKVN